MDMVLRCVIKTCRKTCRGVEAYGSVRQKISVMFGC